MYVCSVHGAFLCVSSCMPVGPVLVTESMLGCVNEHEGVCCVHVCVSDVCICVRAQHEGSVFVAVTHFWCFDEPDGSRQL